MRNVLDQIAGIGILPVIRVDALRDALPLAAALKAGGIPALEVTVRSEAAYDAIDAIARHDADMLVGAGTILSPEMADRAQQAGAKFLVSPHFDRELVLHCRSLGLPIVPCCTTGAEIGAAYSLGLRVVKFFPAAPSGGADAIRLLAGPFPDVRFVPTGGVDFSNLASYLRLDAVAACGGSFMARAELISEGRWAEITALCRKAVAASLGFAFARVELYAADAAQAGEDARTLSALFGWPMQETARELSVSDAVALVKTAPSAARGALCVFTHSPARALVWLREQGVAVRTATIRLDGRGRPVSFCLERTIGGFDIRILHR